MRNKWWEVFPARFSSINNINSIIVPEMFQLSSWLLVIIIFHLLITVVPVIFSCFIKSILKSLVILAIWLALSGAIYSQFALFFALNRIFFSANESKTVKQNNQSHDAITSRWHDTDMFSKWDVNAFLASLFGKPATGSIYDGTDLKSCSSYLGY